MPEIVSVPHTVVVVPPVPYVNVEYERTIPVAGVPWSITPIPRSVVIWIICIWIIPSIVIGIVDRIVHRIIGVVNHAEARNPAINTYSPGKRTVIVPIQISKNRRIIIERSIHSVKPVYPR